jgi:hypothetical protein
MSPEEITGFSLMAAALIISAITALVAAGRKRIKASIFFFVLMLVCLAVISTFTVLDVRHHIVV